MDDLKLQKISDSIGLMQKNLECAICLELLQDPVSTKCDHQFCNFCALALLESSHKPSAPCPLCKIAISKRSLTKNVQLDKIVKAVRSVIKAVQEDTGLQCSPPRGPVLLSQPDPKPRQISPKKKVRGQRVKGRGRAANVRKTKRKTAQTVSVYRDASESSDSDEFELPIVGHTNISFSFPQVKSTGKKGRREGEDNERDLEREAKELLAALNAAPLINNGGMIPGYNSASSNTQQDNSEITLQATPANDPEGERGESAHETSLMIAEKNASNKGLGRKEDTGKDVNDPENSDIFEVPTPVGFGKENAPLGSQGDPYEFIPSQRTPRKAKKTSGRKRKGNKVFSRRKQVPPAPKSGRRWEGEESDPNDVSGNKNKAGDRSGGNSTESTSKQNGDSSKQIGDSSKQIDDSSRRTQKVSSESPCGETIDASRYMALHEEETASLVFPDAGDNVCNNPDDNEAREEICLAGGETGAGKATKVKHPFNITPVVVAQRSTRRRTNMTSSQQSSEGMMPDSQPVVINRNHGKRVFATVYGKAKSGQDKSPPLDPQDRVVEWLVSKNTESDESGDEEEGRRGEENDKTEEDEEEFPAIFEADGEQTEVKNFAQKVPPEKAARKTPRGTNQSSGVAVPEIEGRKTRSSLNRKKNEVTHSERRGNEKRQQKELDNTNKSRRVLSNSDDHSDADDDHKKCKEDIIKEGKQVLHEDIQKTSSPTVHFDIDQEGCDQADTTESETAEPAVKQKTAKQRMVESYLEERTEAKKEAEAATIKSDWELALELARQFGTEPEHLRMAAGEASGERGRSSRRRKGKLVLETTSVSKPVRRTRPHTQDNKGESKRESADINIDDFDTQNLGLPDCEGERLRPKSLTCRRGRNKKSESHLEKTKGQQASNKSVESHPEIPKKNVEDDAQQDKEDVHVSETPLSHTDETGDQIPPTGENSSGDRPEYDKTTAALNRHKPIKVTSQTIEECIPGDRRVNLVERSECLSPAMGENGVDTSMELGHQQSAKLGGKQPLSCIQDKTKEVTPDCLDKQDAGGLEVKVADSREEVDWTPSSLPLYTEDAAIEESRKDGECRGSDTTETIELDVDEEEYEEPVEIIEDNLQCSVAGKSEKTGGDVEKIEARRQMDIPDNVQSLDEEMAIMDGVLPSASQSSAINSSHPSIASSINTAADQAEKAQETEETQESVVILENVMKSSQNDELLIHVREQPISQQKVSGSLSASLESDFQPSESLLKPPKKVKGRSQVLKKASCDSQEVCPERKLSEHGDLTMPDVAIEESISSQGPGAQTGAQEMQQSSSSRAVSKPSSKKRKTFMLGSVEPVASPKKQAVSETLESSGCSAGEPEQHEVSTTQQSRYVTGENGQVEISLFVPNTEDIKKADGTPVASPLHPGIVESQESVQPRRSLRSSSRSSQERMSYNTSSKNKECLPKAEESQNKRSRSLPTKIPQTKRRRGSTKDDFSADSIPSMNVSHKEASCSDSGSSLRIRRKSRNGSRQNTPTSVQRESPRTRRGAAVEAECIAESQLPKYSEMESTCSDGSILSKKRILEGDRHEITSVVLATPGASESNNASSNVICIKPRRTRSQQKLPDPKEDPQLGSSTPPPPPESMEEDFVVSEGMTEIGKDNVKEGAETDPKCKSSSQAIGAEESVETSGAEKEESQESNTSVFSIDDIFNHHENSMDMFGAEEDVPDSEMPASQSVVHSKVEEIPKVEQKIEGTRGDAKHGLQDELVSSDDLASKKSLRRQRTIDIAHANEDIQEVSQRSEKEENTDALIPPTPPVLEQSKFSPGHRRNGLSEAEANRRTVVQEVSRGGARATPLLASTKHNIERSQDNLHGESLVLETPALASRKKCKRTPEDTIVAETPKTPKHTSVKRNFPRDTGTNVERSSSPSLEFLDSLKGDGKTEDNISPAAGKGGYVADLLPNIETLSQTVGDSPLEIQVKSSNESEEMVNRRRAKRKKQVISDDSSDDTDEGEEDIGRPKKRKAQRMVEVGKQEEEESDDELIPCSFLQRPVHQGSDGAKEALADTDNECSQQEDNSGLEADGDCVSSQDSCASHHMNHTSASSILSSQSEIMNTQQAVKTRQQMDALEAEMAALHAALAGGSVSRSEESTEDEDQETGKATQTKGQRSKGKKSLAYPSGESMQSKKRRRSKVLDSEEEEEAEEQSGGMIDVQEPRSPSPPPPIAPSSLRKVLSPAMDSISTVSKMLETCRGTRSSRNTATKRRPEAVDHVKDSSDSDSGDEVAMVSSNSTKRVAHHQITRSSKQRRIAGHARSSESHEDKIQVSSNSAANPRLELSESKSVERPVSTPDAGTSRSIQRTVSGRRTGSHLKTPVSATSSGRGTPGNPTPRDYASRRSQTPVAVGRATPSPGQSPADVSMRTQRTSSEALSVGQTPRGSSRDGHSSGLSSSGGRTSGRSRRTSGGWLEGAEEARPMSLIATGLNRIELRQVEQLTSRLPNCRFASAFNAKTTHVIIKTDSSLVCERTLKYFQGIAAQAWIVSFRWIHDCLAAGKLLDEEDYEVRGDVVNGVDHGGPRTARTWQGPGFLDRYDLCCIGPFTGLNKDQLVSLCEMCGASTVQHPSLFPYTAGRRAFIVVEPNLDASDRDFQSLYRKFLVPVISREWILDSIARYQTQPITDYLLSDQPIIDVDSDSDNDD